jgi:DegV family protein with EDD domain
VQAVAIVTDASVDLPPDLAASVGLVLAPFGYELGGRRYITGQQSPEAFYASLASGERALIEGTSADDFEAALRTAARQATELICVAQSVGSSFTGVSAEVAAHRLQATGTPVALMIPGRSTLGLGALCVAAARSAASGASKDEVFGLLEQGSSSADTYAVPASLDYLEQTGDLAMLSSQSSVGMIDNGIPLFRVRGRVSAAAPAADAAAAEDELLKRVEQTAARRPVIVLVAQSGDKTAANRLADAARRRLNVEELYLTNLGPAIGAVLGPGAYALGFCAVAKG